MESSDSLILIVGGFIFLKFVVYDKVLDEWNNGPSLIEQFAYILSFFWVQVFLISVSIIIFIFLNIYFHNRWLNKAIEKNRKEKQRQEALERVSGLMNKNLSYLNSRELENHIEELETLRGEGIGKKVKKKINATRQELFKKKREEELNAYQNKKTQLQEDIQELKAKKYEEQLKLRNKKEVILEKLDVRENTIYEASELNLEEIKVLKEERFKKINEYDPIHEENVNFFVKQVLNHSYTHTFLVGRIKELIQQYIDPEDIKTHDTRDADLTFEVNHKIYAFEIETGNLLRKKKQLGEKVSYLNNKYGRNWFFVVSNRDLLPEYKKYGPSTPRAGVRKIVEKLVDY